MGKVLTLLALTAAVLSAGCYRYVPADPSELAPGTHVRTRLTDLGIDRMRAEFGPGVLSVNGPLVASSGGGLSVLRETYVRREGFPPTTVFDTLRIEPQHVMSVEVRQLHGPRTGLLAGGLAAGAMGALWAAHIFGGTGEGDGEGGGDPPDASIVLFRIPFRIGLP